MLLAIQHLLEVCSNISYSSRLLAFFPFKQWLGHFAQLSGGVPSVVHCELSWMFTFGKAFVLMCIAVRVSEFFMKTLQKHHSLLYDLSVLSRKKFLVIESGYLYFQQKKKNLCHSLSCLVSAMNIISVRHLCSFGCLWSSWFSVLAVCWCY